MFKDFDLEALKKAHPLPKGQKDLLLNKQEIADFFEVSTNALSQWIKGGMPVHTEGSNGRNYQFSIHDCFAWFRGWKESQSDDLKTRQRQIAQLRLSLLGDDADEDMVSLSTRQQRESYEAAEQYIKTALLKRDLVRAAEVVMMLEGVFSVTRNFMLGLPDIMERQIGLTPDQAENMVKLCKQQVAAFRDQLGQSNLAIVLEAEPAATAKPKRRASGAKRR